MPEEQLALFAEGRGGSAGEPTGPVTTVPAALNENSSLASAITNFHPFMVRQGFSDNTIRAFQADLHLLCRRLAPNRAIGSIGQADLEQFLTWLRVERNVPCSPKSYARRLTTLKVFFGWLTEAKILEHDPAAPLIHEHPLTPLPEILYDSEINAALRTAQDLVWATKPDSRPCLLFNLVLTTGIKKSECMAVQLEHLDFSNPSAPVLFVRYADPRKSLKERRLALGPGFTPVYRQYLREYEPKDRLFDCTPRNLEYVFADLADRAGISGGISFEQLRWTCAVRDYRRGVAPGQLRQKLGLSLISWRETLPKIQRLARPAL